MKIHVFPAEGMKLSVQRRKTSFSTERTNQYDPNTGGTASSCPVTRPEPARLTKQAPGRNPAL